MEAQLASTLEQIGEKSQPERMSQRVYEKSPAPSDSSTIGEQDVSSSSSETLHLPPLDELVRAVQTFSENCNWSLPLFHIPTLLRMIHGWYSMPHQRSPVKWAAINVVLALAYHGGSGDLRAADYLSKAQSAMTTIIMDPHPELLNIQVIVGMVAIFQGARDLQPALILIATAMRLIHRLGIHSRRGLVGMDPAIAAQCTRVFWVAYVFDKDLSIRACVPSVQQDDDIDLDLPSDYLLTSDDSWGAFDANAMIRENYLMARVQLARIEGRVYDDMISARSQMWDIDRRTGAALALLAELERWKARLPGPLRICNNVQTVAPDLLRSLSILHAASITCEAHIHVAHAHDEPWTKSLSDYASGQEVQLSTGWQAPGLAHESRQFMTLFNSVPNQDLGFRWYVMTFKCVKRSRLTASSKQDCRMRILLDNADPPSKYDTQSARPIRGR